MIMLQAYIPAGEDNILGIHVRLFKSILEKENIVTKKKGLWYLIKRKMNTARNLTRIQELCGISNIYQNNPTKMRVG